MSWLIFNSEFLSKNLAGGVSVHYTYHVALQLKVSEQEVRWVNGLEWIWTVMTIGAPVVLKIAPSPLQKQCNGFPKFEHHESEILKGGVVHFATESIF